MRLMFWRRKPREFFVPDCRDHRDDAREADHYFLAHIALREVAFLDPDSFMESLRGRRAAHRLAHLIRWINEHRPEPQKRLAFVSSDLTVHPLRIAGYPSVVIEMPQPHGSTRAFYVAAVLLGEAVVGASGPACEPLRYFTLELGSSGSDPAQGRTVLCEWTSVGSHINYGDGPAPNLGAFLRSVEELLQPSTGCT